MDDDPEWEPYSEGRPQSFRGAALAGPSGPLLTRPCQDFRSASEPLNRPQPGAGDDEPIYCQVLGCRRDIRHEKDYYQRYRICEEHLKLSSLLKDGVPQRFCQQCGRFHELSDFDGEKRSCRARLSLHNNRRRKRGTGGGDGGGKGRRQRARQRRAPTTLEERRTVRSQDAALLMNVPRLTTQSMHSIESGAADTSNSGGSSATLRGRGHPFEPRAMSMSESAGFQAPPELLSAMELMSGDAPYAFSDMQQLQQAAASRMVRHRSLTSEPQSAADYAPDVLFKSASDPAHVMAGVQGLAAFAGSWGGEALPFGQANKPLSMRQAIESGLRLEPHMLQQYAAASGLHSVRIPPPAHEGGGLINPFSAAGVPFGQGPLHSSYQREQQMASQSPSLQKLQHQSLQRASDPTLPMRLELEQSDSFRADSSNTLQRWSSSEGLGRRMASAEGLGSRLSSMSQHDPLGSRLSSHEALGARLSSHASSSEPITRAFSGGWPSHVAPPQQDPLRPFVRHSSAEGMRLPPRISTGLSNLQRPGLPVGQSSLGGQGSSGQSFGPLGRRLSPTDLAARIAASSEHLLGPGGTAMPGDPYHGVDVDAVRLERLNRLPPPEPHRMPVQSGIVGGPFGDNPFSSLSDSHLSHRSRMAYAQEQAMARAQAAALPPLFDDVDFVAPAPVLLSATAERRHRAGPNGGGSHPTSAAAATPCQQTNEPMTPREVVTSGMPPIPGQQQKQEGADAVSAATSLDSPPPIIRGSSAPVGSMSIGGGPSSQLVEGGAHAGPRSVFSGGFTVTTGDHHGIPSPDDPLHARLRDIRERLQLPHSSSAPASEGGFALMPELPSAEHDWPSSR